MIRLIAFGLAFGLLAASCTRGGDRTGLVTFRTTSGQVATGSIRIADTASERQHGLMGVSDLPSNDGMVFLFDGPTRSSFWMKDTLIPLSVAFWNGSGTVVDVLDMQPCMSDPCPLYTPRGPYTTALEMNLGWFLSHGITIGDHAALSRTGS